MEIYGFFSPQIKEVLERVISSSFSPRQAVLLKSFQSTCHISICHLPIQVFRGLQRIILEDVIIWLQIQHVVWLFL